MVAQIGQIVLKLHLAVLGVWWVGSFSPLRWRLYLRLAAFALLITLLGGLVSDALAQKTSPGKKDRGKGKTNPVIIIEEEGSKNTAVVPQRIYIVPYEGYLALVTEPTAEVVLQGLSTRGIRGTYLASDRGELKLAILPGNYRVEIKREDFNPVSRIIKIKKRDVTMLTEPLVSKYGTVVLGMDEQVVTGVTVRLDGEVRAPSWPENVKGKAYITRVPIGAHHLSLSKDGYDNWTQQLEVKPGESSENMVTVTLTRAAITLMVKTQKDAWVYIDNESKGQVPSERTLQIPDLLPGPHKLQVSLDGYESVERLLNLTLERREQEEEVKLELLTADPEEDITFDQKIKYWWPNLPQGWSFATEKPLGLKVTGDEVALLNTTTKPHRQFNLYRNFTLVLNVSFTNSKGAAWVVRAQDTQNHYLFELTTSNCTGQGNCLNFYVCRNGVCERHGPSSPVFAKIEKPGASFRIYLDVIGNRFSHRIVDTTDPKAEPDNLGRVFEDDTFSWGGVGLRAINGLEMFVGQFTIKPGQ